MHQYMLEVNKLESSLAGQDLMVLLDNKLTISQQCTRGKASQQYLGLH